jgi:hypothetical protein
VVDEMIENKGSGFEVLPPVKNLVQSATKTYPEDKRA